eukprot:724545-Prymnesium_polylepis.4
MSWPLGHPLDWLVSGSPARTVAADLTASDEKGATEPLWHPNGSFIGSAPGILAGLLSNARAASAWALSSRPPSTSDM